MRGDISMTFLHTNFANVNEPLQPEKKFYSVFTCFSNSAVAEDVFHLVERVNKRTDVPSRIEADRTDLKKIKTLFLCRFRRGT